MSSTRKQFKIYGPAHFRATWENFLAICKRDGTSGSEQIRIWVEGYVARKDPGNPQRPLTAYVEGHGDQLAARRSDVLKHFIERADRVGGWVRHREIIEVLKAQGWPGHNRVEVAYSLGRDLKKFDIVVQY